MSNKSYMELKGESIEQSSVGKDKVSTSPTSSSTSSFPAPAVTSAAELWATITPSQSASLQALHQSMQANAAMNPLGALTAAAQQHQQHQQPQEQQQRQQQQPSHQQPPQQRPMASKREGKNHMKQEMNEHEVKHLSDEHQQAHYGNIPQQQQQQQPQQAQQSQQQQQQLHQPASTSQQTPDQRRTSSDENGKPPVGSAEWHRLRRENHKQVERRRRETINEGINEIARIVPGCEKNKGSILQRAAAYIQQLKDNEAATLEKWTLEKLLTDQAINELNRQVELLKAELDRTRQENQYLKRQLDGSGDGHEHKKMKSSHAEGQSSKHEQDQ
ncbi:basic helix-loop-helix protein [Apophysomyces ossiformis]|uniref:Basic helix-loop-helix protein n=1 Tax=Apophysomyces ossiformis TaxID=679940 RepID=A0A8H7BKZ4_9FUNG|nr:basic helix-loop-helix protein [Apophysomyces ossiformis]